MSNVCSSRIEFGCFLQNVSLWQMPFDAIQLIARWPHDAHTQVIFSSYIHTCPGLFFAYFAPVSRVLLQNTWRNDGLKVVILLYFRLIA